MALGTLGLLVAGTMGCGLPSPPGDGRVVLRFADDDRGEFFDEQAGLFESRETFSWDFGEEDSRHWRIEAGVGRIERRREGLWILDADGPMTLTREVALRAEELHAVQVTVEGMGQGQVRLCWAGAGEELSSFRCVTERIPGIGGRLVELELAKNPLWSGEIKLLQLRLEPWNSVNRVYVGSFVGLRKVARPELLAAALARSWKVTLELDAYRDTRTALLAPPGVVIERQLQVPEGASLHLSYGLQAGVMGTVRFRVAVRRRGTGEPTLIFERSLATVLEPSAEPRWPGWQDARVDLADFAGETVDLLLTTEASGPLDFARGFPLWGHPQVVAPDPSPTPPNVVLVSVDTLRADHLSLYGYERGTSPNVDAWARSCATTFEKVVAAAPWTIPSHASMLTGRDALSHGSNHESRIPTTLMTLPEILRESGYTTAAVTGGGYLNASYGFSQGFDRYLAWRQRSEAATEPEIGVDKALEWLEKPGPTPFFLFLHTYGLHTPYYPRQPYLSRFRKMPEDAAPRWIGSKMQESRAKDGFILKLDLIWLEDPRQFRQGTPIKPSELDWGRDLYDSGIAFVDSQLARLFAGLRRLGHDRDTIVILTSDHGESLGEKGLVGHTSLYDTDLLVPLVISRPGCESGGRRVPGQVRSIDIVPTVLELVGAAPEQPIDGVSLAPLLEGRPMEAPREAWSYTALANYGVALRLDNRLKYIFNNTAWDPVQGRQELYRLTEDEAESHNLAAEDARVDELRERVRKRLADAAGGVRLRFSNKLSVPFHGLIEPTGSWGSKRWTRVKSWDLPAGRLSWSPSGPLAFRVEAHEAFDVVLDLQGEGDLRVSCALDGQEPFSAVGRAGETGGAWQVRYAGTSWHEGEPLDDEPLTGILTTWPDRSSSAEVDPAQSDPELLQQLKALGYVN